MFAAIRHALLIGTVQWLMVASYLWVWLRARVGWPLSDEARSRVHRRHARRFKRAASKLKGGNIKLGQLASMQPHVFPQEYVDEFKSLRDEVEPTPWSEISRASKRSPSRPPRWPRCTRRPSRRESGWR